MHHSFFFLLKLYPHLSARLRLFWAMSAWPKSAIRLAWSRYALAISWHNKVSCSRSTLWIVHEENVKREGRLMTDFNGAKSESAKLQMTKMISGSLTLCARFNCNRTSSRVLLGTRWILGELSNMFGNRTWAANVSSSYDTCSDRIESKKKKVGCVE